MISLPKMHISGSKLMSFARPPKPVALAMATEPEKRAEGNHRCTPLSKVNWEGGCVEVLGVGGGMVGWLVGWSCIF